MLLLNRAKLYSATSLTWRLSLAIVGGFILTSLFCVWLPQILNSLFGVNVTSSFVWCLLGAFAIYCTLIMWLVATTQLFKASITMIITGLIIWYGITPPGVTA